MSKIIFYRRLRSPAMSHSYYRQGWWQGYSVLLNSVPIQINSIREYSLIINSIQIGAPIWIELNCWEHWFVPCGVKVIVAFKDPFFKGQGLECGRWLMVQTKLLLTISKESCLNQCVDQLLDVATAGRKGWGFCAGYDYNVIYGGFWHTGVFDTWYPTNFQWF